MGISIKHDVYESAIRQLATERGVSLTEAIGLAVRNELARSAPTPETFDERVRRAQAMVAALPVLDPRPYREMLYGEDGLPI